MVILPYKSLNAFKVLKVLQTLQLVVADVQCSHLTHALANFFWNLADQVVAQIQNFHTMR